MMGDPSIARSYLCWIEQSDANDARFFAHQKPRVDIDRSSIANNNNPSGIGSKQLQIGIEIDIRQHFKDQINSFTIDRRALINHRQMSTNCIRYWRRSYQNLLQIAFLLMITNEISPLVTYGLQALLGWGRANHA